jgi:hypothetical protein
LSKAKKNAEESENPPPRKRGSFGGRKKKGEEAKVSGKALGKEGERKRIKESERIFFKR